MNSVNLMGRLTADPELRYTPQSTPVCSFTLAVDRPGVKDKTDFIGCVAWRQTAEAISKYLHKGGKIAVTGVLAVNKYQAKDGGNRIRYEVLVDRFYFADSRGEAQRQGAPAPEYQEIPEDEDLPF